MATIEVKDLTANVNRVIAAKTGADKSKIFSEFDQPMKKAVRDEIRRRESRGKDMEVEEESLEGIDWGKIGGAGGDVTGLGEVVEEDTGGAKIVISDQELDEIWESIESDDTSDFDDSVAGSFDYQGFNADIILKQIMNRGKRQGLSNKEILRDISSMCAASHKKGSITDNNYKKMTKAGQSEYDRLAQRYSLVKGGAKGSPPETISISRIGPTFSAKIIRLILDGKLGPKTFTGPMRSSTLPSIMQTQFFISVVSKSTPERTLSFLSALSQAYSVDQSLSLMQGRKKPVEEVWMDQASFIALTSGSNHPSEEARKSMMTKISWPQIYDKTSACIEAIKRIDNTFIAPSRTEFLADLAVGAK
jgi:hypothetical protein